MSEKIVEISNLLKIFNAQSVPAINNISVELKRKNIIGLIGPDGAGKTTLIRIMAGLLKPTSGYVKILGYDTIKEAKKIHDVISYMPQRFGLYEDLTVKQNLDLYSDLFDLDKTQRDQQYEILLKFTNLKRFTKRLAGKLSGGMKQKLGLACTLLRRPKILLLDEPSFGVDPISRRELWEMIKELTKENITVLWSTSYLDEAERCEDVVVLNEGNLLYYGAPEKLTDGLKGRTFQIQNIIGDRRKVLSNILKDEHVIDAAIQGSFVRVVAKDSNVKFDMNLCKAGDKAVLKEVAPRFEDAFMDMLGKTFKKESPIASLLSKISISDKPVIVVKKLMKKFGDFIAVDDTSFSVKQGEIFGLLGPNGAGKSTTFKMLCGLLKPTSGEAFISGKLITDVKNKVRSSIGYMAQKFSLYDNMTVLQNLEFFSGIYSIEAVNRRKIIDKMILTFDLGPFQKFKAHDLPFGFKQRLALSCAIMHNPEILFLDEPTSGVDPLTRREFWNHINGMVSRGISIVITTHFMDEAEYCDRIALINHGKIVKIGSPDELKQSVVSDNLPSPTLEDAFILLSSSSEDKENA